MKLLNTENLIEVNQKKYYRKKSRQYRDDCKYYECLVMGYYEADGSFGAVSILGCTGTQCSGGSSGSTIKDPVSYGTGGSGISRDEEDEIPYLAPGMIKDKYDGCYFPEDQLINELTGKAKCIYEKLKSLALFQSTIAIFENDENYNLTFTSGGECNNDAEDGCTDALNISNGEIEIRILNEQLGTLDLAATILHEGIHAELFKYVDEYKKGIDPNDRENLLSYYFEYKVDSGGNKFATQNAQHQHMADAYITPLAKALRELDNNNYPVNDYYSLAWDGQRTYGVDGYYNENLEYVRLDSDESYEGRSKILNNTTFNSGCNE